MKCEADFIPLEGSKLVKPSYPQLYSLSPFLNLFLFDQAYYVVKEENGTTSVWFKNERLIHLDYKRLWTLNIKHLRTKICLC